MIGKIIYTAIRFNSYEEMIDASEIVEEIVGDVRLGEQSIIIDSLDKETLDTIMEQCDGKGIISPAHLMYYDENGMLNSGVYGVNGLGNEWDLVC